MKYRSIIISGPVASGTTTTAKALSEKLNLEFQSAGDYFRNYLLKHNIHISDIEKIPVEIDKKTDAQSSKLVEKSDGIVFDSLYLGYFCRNMPHVLKVLLTANEDIRIKRALARTHTHKETAQDVRKRDKAQDNKFRKLYADENFLDPKFFDLVIDTTNLKPEEVVQTIQNKFLSSNYSN